jgi:hypothetical protein
MVGGWAAKVRQSEGDGGKWTACDELAVDDEELEELPAEERLRMERGDIVVGVE